MANPSHSLHPSRSASLESQAEIMDQDSRSTNEKSHKLDLYSIPVFLLELFVLCGLVYSANYIHFQRHPKPSVGGFYCDEISYRQTFKENDLTKVFGQKDQELIFLSLLLVLPTVLIIFCELVNSMFGALKFRQIRALCTCCKLHSITRRSIRFSGAYILGFLMVMISSDLLASSTGRLRPYFAQECPNAYQQCATPGLGKSQPNLQLELNATMATTTMATVAQVPSRDHQQLIFGRQWIHLADQDLDSLCQFPSSSKENNDFKYSRIAMSWPSFPAAILTYACLFLSVYLSFVGTARPFRIITCIIIMLLLIFSATFDVQMVKNNVSHWDDSIAGAVLALIVVVFVVFVYLNKFKDAHYYENQKFANNGRSLNNDSFRGYGNDTFEMNKIGGSPGNNSNAIGGGQNGMETGGARSLSNNDLAMRYFQIPRANYRGSHMQGAVNRVPILPNDN